MELKKNVLRKIIKKGPVEFTIFYMPRKHIKKVSPATKKNHEKKGLGKNPVPHAYFASLYLVKNCDAHIKKKLRV